MELNCYDDEDNPSFGWEVYVQRLVSGFRALVSVNKHPNLTISAAIFNIGKVLWKLLLPLTSRTRTIRGTVRVRFLVFRASTMGIR